MGYWVTRVVEYLLGAALAQGSLYRGFLEGGSEEGVQGQGLREGSPDLWSTCVRKHRGSSPEKKIYLRNIVSCIYLFWDSGVTISWAESKIAGFNLSRSEGASLA